MTWFREKSGKTQQVTFFQICASLRGVSVMYCVQILTLCGQYILSYETVSPRLVIKNLVKDSNFLSRKNLVKDSNFCRFVALGRRGLVAWV